jgi:hypothetical protein
MKKLIIIFFLICCYAFSSEDMTISFRNYKFDPLLSTPKLRNSLKTTETERENYYILQFTGPIYTKWKEQISEAGGVFHSYVPHFAYIVQMTPEERNEIEKFSFVRWIGLFHPEYKIHPNVYKKRGNEVENALPAATAVIEDNKVKIIKKQQCNCSKDALWIQNDPLLHLSVRFFTDASLDNIADTLEKWGADIQQIQKSCNRMILRIPPNSLNAMANLGKVQSIVPYSKKVLSSSVWRYSVQVPMDSFTIQQDDDLGKPWDTVTSGITLADKGITGEGEIITIFDSGLDYWSAFFQDPEDDPPGPSHIVVEAYTDEGGDLQEVSSSNKPGGCSHGTNVASIIAGNLSIADNHPNGGNLMHFYDWGGQTRGNIVDHFPVRLYIQDFATTDGDTCRLGSFDFPDAMNKAYNTYNSRIHQDSWNYSDTIVEGEYYGESIDVDNTVWNNKDFVVVFSAGNKGPDANTIMPPATAKNCISVGSSWVPSFDFPPDSITIFSSRGWTTDGRIKPDVVAPGGTDSFDYSRQYIWGARADTIWAADSAHTNLLGMGGTSQAAPHISSACAMIRQYFKDGFHPTGDTLSGTSFEPSAALVKATLIASTVDMGADEGKGNPVPNRAEGWGRVVLDNALYFAGESRALVVSDNATGVSTGDSTIYTVTIVNSAEPLKFVLAWSDTAAMVLAEPSLVNDLDLTVTAPNSNRYRGNVFTNGFSNTGGSADRVNNVELVWLPTPVQLGIYSISVKGHNVPSGYVPFAIAVVGGTSGPIVPPVNGEPEPQYLNIRSPFIEETEIQLILPNTANINLTIYDVLGRKIKTLINERIEPDTAPLTWGKDVNPGLYFAVLKIDGKEVEKSKIIKISK